MASKLVIVEAPAKVRTLQNFLGKQYKIAASMGHVRDLPKTRMGVDVEAGFEPTFRVLPEKRDTIKKLVAAAAKCDQVILATDPDREGEAIAWHLAAALDVREPVRIEFNEITKGAVLEALKHPREIDPKRVDAYQARRILDRLVGYELSPLISRKVRTRGLSAGRVQSVALRLIVEREREIRAFVSEEYWSLIATLSPRQEDAPFLALHPCSKQTRLSIKNAEEAQAIADAVAGAAWMVEKVSRSTRKRRPRPPFMTSTLQQAASSRHAFSASRTLRVAQSLYEGKELGDEGQVGLITYMRTDSTRVAVSAQEEARTVIAETYGSEYLPDKPPIYSRAKGQDAHEAIRPTYVSRTPDSLAKYLSPDELKLYRLIWERFVASQMAPAIVESVRADIRAGDYLFRARGSRIDFAGWLAVTGAGEEAFEGNGGGKGGDGEDDEADEIAQKGLLPDMKEGQELDFRGLEPKQHFTQPPPRFTEAQLIAELEARGVGRPSTYAATVEVIKQREYVELLERRFVPTPLGFVVNDLLVEHFGDIVDVDFTARMEEGLDSVDRGERPWRELLAEFYSGFSRALGKAREEMEETLPEVGEDCPECGKPLIMRRGRNGSFVACSGYPECRYVKRDGSGPVETGEMCPECGKPMVRRQGRKGEFEACSGYPECKYVKRDPALEPQPTDETCPKCGSPLLRRVGRYGPFLGCSAYPKCRYIKDDGQRAPRGTGVPCPEEGCDGELMRRVSAKRKSVFYGCSRYPKCRYTSSLRPVARPCPECGAKHLVWKEPRDGAAGNGELACPNKECEYSEPVDDDLAKSLRDDQVAANANGGESGGE